MVGEVVQGAGSTSGSLSIVAVGHSSDKSCHHLRGVHDGMSTGLLLGELMDHHSGLVHYNLQQQERERERVVFKIIT